MRALAAAMMVWMAMSPRVAAQEAEPAAETEEAEAEDGDEARGYRLRWTFPEVHPVEYVIGFGGQIGLPILRAVLDEPSALRWTSNNAFDDGIQDAIGRNGESTRRVAALLSDITWYSNTAWPFVDALVVAWLLDGNTHVAWQMFAISVSATALDGFLAILLIYTTGRHRPSTRYCLEEGGEPSDCKVDNTKSFPSGHTAGSFTGAGLTCAHHGALPLYGGGEHDVAACIAALTLATTTGITRIIADKHYTIDVLAGAGIGLTFGWLLPWLLHYRFDPDEADARESAVTDLMLLPFGDETGAAGLSVAGSF